VKVYQHQNEKDINIRLKIRNR